MKEEIDKAALKKLFKNGIDSVTGEVIPGMKIEETENVNIKFE